MGLPFSLPDPLDDGLAGSKESVNVDMDDGERPGISSNIVLLTETSVVRLLIGLKEGAQSIP